MMDVTLQYIDGCPNWETTDRHVATLAAEGMEATIAYELIQSYEVAVERGFGGSPTVLIDGVDPFADQNHVVGLTCRIYGTEFGPAGSPTLDQLREAIAGALTNNSSHDD